MNTLSDIKLPVIGEYLPDQGGFFDGIFILDGIRYGQVSAPKADGEFTGKWSESYTDIPGARSYVDGLSNTMAMAEAESELAKRVIALRIGGHSDWHIGARDQVELQYRNHKPTAEENCCSFRDGENPSSVPVSYPYTPDSPTQTEVSEFQDDGEEAFEEEWYWSSTQYSAYYAWNQNFGYGYQDGNGKDGAGRARAVRRFPI